MQTLSENIAQTDTLHNAEYIDKTTQGDSLELLGKLAKGSIDLAITSPPYFGCRVYGNETLGRESNPIQYVKNILAYTEKIKTALKPTGSFYLNVGDVYFGTKGFSRNKGRYARKTDQHYKEHTIVKPDGKYLQHKQQLMLPERIAIGMQEQGWILRNKIIWEKPNPVPAHAWDRRLPVYEHVFFFVKAKKYFYDYALAKQLKQHRDVIKCGIKPFVVHQATFPVELIEPFILISSSQQAVVLDPFMGSGTVGAICKKHNRHFIGFEINPSYCDLANKQIDLNNK